MSQPENDAKTIIEVLEKELEGYKKLCGVEDDSMCLISKADLAKLQSYVPKEPEIIKDYPANELYDAGPNCAHEVIDNFYGGGGVKCRKCGGWYCA